VAWNQPAENGGCSSYLTLEFKTLRFRDDNFISVEEIYLILCNVQLIIAVFIYVMLKKKGSNEK